MKALAVVLWLLAWCAASIAAAAAWAALGGRCNRAQAAALSVAAATAAVVLTWAGTAAW